MSLLCGTPCRPSQFYPNKRTFTPTASCTGLGLFEARECQLPHRVFCCGVWKVTRVEREGLLSRCLEMVSGSSRGLKAISLSPRQSRELCTHEFRALASHVPSIDLSLACGSALESCLQRHSACPGHSGERKLAFRGLCFRSPESLMLP